MIPFFKEYQVDHHRFREHHTVAVAMSLVAPACAIFFFQELGWWNPWLWGCCGAGLALALCLHSVILMLKSPDRLTPPARALARRAVDWFPFFFVVMQSSIAALILMFVWFSITSLTLVVPLYVHVVAVLLAILLPTRRFIAAKMTVHPPPAFERTNELFHALWHILISVFLARFIITLTVSPTANEASPSVFWRIMIWTPACIYILYTCIATFYHLAKLKPIKRVKAPDTTEGIEEPVDRF